MSQSPRDGRDWQPQFLLDIDRGTCIGCGRCFKVCGRGVMTLRGIDEGGEVVDLDDEDEIERKVMVMDDDGNCIPGVTNPSYSLAVIILLAINCILIMFTTYTKGMRFFLYRMIEDLQ